MTLKQLQLVNTSLKIKKLFNPYAAPAPHALLNIVHDLNPHIHVAQAYNGLIQHIRDPAERATKSKEICENIQKYAPSHPDITL